MENFIHRFTEFAAKMPEVPLLYNRWAAVSAVAVTLAKSFYVKRGIWNVYPNLYLMLIGSPGTGKGTVCAELQTVLTLADYRAFAADKSSKEKFIQDLADGFDFKDNTRDSDSGFESLRFDEINNLPAECFILAEEFNDFIGQNNNGEFVSLLTKLWSYTGTYRNRLKTGKSVEIFEPCINIFSANTHAGFALAFPPEIMGQGFLARFIMVYGESTGKRVSFPVPPDPEEATSLARLLLEIKANVRGEASIGVDAVALLDEINQSWNGFKDDLRFQHYNSRRFTQLLKLCVIYAASRKSLTITEADVIEANTLLLDTEDVMQKALGEFGKAKNADVNGKVMQAIYEAASQGNGLNVTQLWKLVCNDLDQIGDLAKILQNLASAEKIQHIKDKGWFPRLTERKRDGRHTKH